MTQGAAYLSSGIAVTKEDEAAWRLLQDAQISPDFGNMMDASHGGRIGNTVTVNGHIPEAFAVHDGKLPVQEPVRRKAAVSPQIVRRNDICCYGNLFDVLFP